MLPDIRERNLTSVGMVAVILGRILHLDMDCNLWLSWICLIMSLTAALMVPKSKSSLVEGEDLVAGMGQDVISKAADHIKVLVVVQAVEAAEVLILVWLLRASSEESLLWVLPLHFVGITTKRNLFLLKLIKHQPKNSAPSIGQLLVKLLLLQVNLMAWND